MQNAYAVKESRDEQAGFVLVFLTREAAKEAAIALAMQYFTDFGHPEKVSKKDAIKTLETAYEIYLSVVKLTEA